jgi:hypothetical protein
MEEAKNRRMSEGKENSRMSKEKREQQNVEYRMSNVEGKARKRRKGKGENRRMSKEETLTWSSKIGCFTLEILWSRRVLTRKTSLLILHGS